jgi:hypothetical protein
VDLWQQTPPLLASDFFEDVGPTMYTRTSEEQMIYLDRRQLYAVCTTGGPPCQSRTAPLRHRVFACVAAIHLALTFVLDQR